MLLSKKIFSTLLRIQPHLTEIFFVRANCMSSKLLFSASPACRQSHQVKLQSSTFGQKMFSHTFPCNIGDSVDQVETPCLVICLDKLYNNIQTMNQIMNSNFPKVALRPHAKAHKCAALGKIQVENGAVGLCCQTLSEAEVMVKAGLKDIFVSNQVIGKTKVHRLASLAQHAKISVCVDDSSNIKSLSEAAVDLGVNLDLVVEVNVGQDRCGVDPGVAVVSLAKEVMSLPGVTFKGVQCYNGWNQHIRNASDRRAEVGKVVERTRTILKLLKESEIDCNYVTGGGTGSFLYEAESGLFTEVQPGSYVFMDADYNKNLNKEGRVLQDFEQSLYVLATVQSVSGQDRAVLDAGLKAVSHDSGVPLIKSGGDTTQTVSNGGDEHGIVKPRGNLEVGARVWLVPGHCDPTVNLYNWLVGLRDGRVECIWPVDGRGPGV